eukprot:TRINITY_DN8306_c0_g1_i4.p1 TRINITY_DN8306_c0_g1~~TRINITY_DN8306_c0_g1_i4.p1  ORF type:complete len:417 (+),score=56.15 TRINITY_DN8306_c0_g1_i4:62-1312(+)
MSFKPNTQKRLLYKTLNTVCQGDPMARDREGQKNDAGTAAVKKSSRYSHARSSLLRSGESENNVSNSLLAGESTTNDLALQSNTSMLKGRSILSILSPNTVQICISDQELAVSRESKLGKSASTFGFPGAGEDQSTICVPRRPNRIPSVTKNPRKSSSSSRSLVLKTPKNIEINLSEVLQHEVKTQRALESRLVQERAEIRVGSKFLRDNSEENRHLEITIKKMENRVKYLEQTDKSIKKKIETTKGRIRNFLHCKSERELNRSQQEKSKREEESRLRASRQRSTSSRSVNLASARTTEGRGFHRENSKDGSLMLKTDRSQISTEEANRKQSKKLYTEIARQRSKNKRLNDVINVVANEKLEHLRQLQREKERKLSLQKRLQSLEYTKQKLVQAVQQSYEKQTQVFGALSELCGLE